MPETFKLIVLHGARTDRRKSKYKIVLDGSSLNLIEAETDGRELEIARLPSLGSRERNVMVGLLSALVHQKRVWVRLHPEIFKTHGRTNRKTPETLFGTSWLDALLTRIVVERFRPALIAGPATIRLLNELAYRLDQAWTENGKNNEIRDHGRTGEEALLGLYGLYAGTTGEEEAKRELDRLTAEILLESYPDVFDGLTPGELAGTVEIWDVALMDMLVSLLREPSSARLLFGSDVKLKKTRTKPKYALILTLRKEDGQYGAHITENFTVLELVRLLSDAGLVRLETMKNYVEKLFSQEPGSSSEQEGAVLPEAWKFLLSLLHKRRKLSLDMLTGTTFVCARPGKLVFCSVENRKCTVYTKHEDLLDNEETLKTGNPLVYEPETVKKLGEEFFGNHETYRVAVQTGCLNCDEGEPVNRNLVILRKNGKWIAMLRTRNGRPVLQHGKIREQVLNELQTYLLRNKHKFRLVKEQAGKNGKLEIKLVGEGGQELGTIKVDLTHDNRTKPFIKPSLLLWMSERTIVQTGIDGLQR